MTTRSEGPLATCVKSALERYFRELDGEDAIDLYDMVLAQMEKPLLECLASIATPCVRNSSPMVLATAYHAKRPNERDSLFTTRQFATVTKLSPNLYFLKTLRPKYPCRQ
jgi:hypothetical protein